MEFLFFGYDDTILFTRSDAESANWQVDELSLTCLFPYDPGKVIERGMRIAFEDAEGVLQPFEIRKVRTYEPDHYQEITAEHIIISELTDVHTDDNELTNVTPSSALTSVLDTQPIELTGVKRWAVGNVTATATSSGDITVGSAFQNIRMIEQNWNVYINPRVTFDASGITGRYLDIVPAEGVWHGVRLSIDKNADEMGVTIDDTEVKTAMYGYGGTDHTITQNQLEYTSTKITLAGYNWTNPPSGCSKATADNYVVDTAATAMYGRDGVPRFGFYQNADITDQATLAQKTWEALQAENKPTVTVDCMVKDLYRMGYHDEPIRLHDTVFVEIRPINDVLQLEIIKLAVDLLDPTATRPTIGAYIPNIVYIQRQTANAATGGSSGRISGKSKNSQDKKQAEWSEFVADYTVNNMVFSYHASQLDRDNNILRQAGLDIDSQTGVIIYHTDNTNMIGSKFQVQANEISSLVQKTGVNDLGQNETLYSKITQTESNISTIVSKTGINDLGQNETLYSEISQNASSISQIVTAVGDNGQVTAASIVTAINAQTGQSEVLISADKIALDGTTIINLLLGGAVDVYSLTANEVIAGELIFDDGGGTTETSFSTVTIGNKSSPQQIKFLGDGGFSQASTITYADFPHYHKIVATEGTGANAGRITITLTNEVSTSDTTEHITNFNIAATQFYIDGVAAARLAGIAEGESHFSLASVTVQGTPHSVTPISGGGWYCLTGNTYTVQGSVIYETLYYKRGEDYYIYNNYSNVYNAGTQTVTAASGSYYRYSAGTQLDLYDAGQTYTNTYYTKTS